MGTGGVLFKGVALGGWCPDVMGSCGGRRWPWEGGVGVGGVCPDIRWELGLSCDVVCR